ncbi:MAG: hypothetical protein K2X97_02655, partial [Mycobacteriaceae bacterium]|nr:hypothetical protein [Mycobacteriaceae bacterium]
MSARPPNLLWRTVIAAITARSEIALTKSCAPQAPVAVQATMVRRPATDPLECLDFCAVCTLDGSHGRIEVAVMAGDDDQIDR